MNVEPAANIVITSKLSRKKKRSKTKSRNNNTKNGENKKTFFFLVRCIVFLSFLRCSSIRCSAYMSIVPATKQYNDFKHKYIPFSFPVSPPLRSSHAICREKNSCRYIPLRLLVKGVCCFDVSTCDFLDILFSHTFRALDTFERNYACIRWVSLFCVRNQIVLSAQPVVSCQNQNEPDSDHFISGRSNAPHLSHKNIFFTVFYPNSTSTPNEIEINFWIYLVCKQPDRIAQEKRNRANNKASMGRAKSKRRSSIRLCTVSLSMLVFV